MHSETLTTQCKLFHAWCLRGFCLWLFGLFCRKSSHSNLHFLITLPQWQATIGIGIQKQSDHWHQRFTGFGTPKLLVRIFRVEKKMEPCMCYFRSSILYLYIIVVLYFYYIFKKLILIYYINIKGFYTII